MRGILPKIHFKFLKPKLKIKLIYLCVLAASCVPGLLALLPGIAKTLPIVATFIPPFPAITSLTILFPFGSVVRTIAVTPDGSRLYVANGWNNTVSVIDVSRNEVIDIVHVFPEPISIAITPDGSKVYVACPDTQKIAVIDVRTNKVIKTIDIEIEEDLRCCVGPTGITITSDGSKAYVTNKDFDNSGLQGQTVSVIDTSTDEVIKTITVGLEPISIAITPDGSKAYVANFGSNTVSVIEEVVNEEGESSFNVTHVDVGIAPIGIAITPDDPKAYVANAGSNSVSVIDTATDTIVGTPIGVGSEPAVIIISPDGSNAYVTNTGSNSVSVIDTATDTIVGTPIGVGPNPISIAITGDNSKLYVANQGTLSNLDNTVSVVDIPSNVVTEIPLTKTNVFSLIALGITRSRLYVANINTIDVIDISTDKVIGTIPAGGSGPSRIAITPDGTKAYVTNSGRGTVSAIDVSTDKVIKTIKVGSMPVDIEITPDGAKAFVANSGLLDELGGDTVSVIRTSDDQVIATIEVGSQPVDIEITPDGTEAYVANFQGSSISIIDVSMDEVITTVDIKDHVLEAIDLSPVDIEITDPDGLNGPDDPIAYVVTSDVVVAINVSNNMVNIINLQQFPVSSSFKAISMSITPDGSWAYVVNHQDSSVSVMDVQRSVTDPENAVIGTVNLGCTIDTEDDMGQALCGPAFIGITPDSSKAYVVIPGNEFLFGETGETVLVIDVEKLGEELAKNPDEQILQSAVIDTVNVGSDSKPTGIAVTSDGAKVLVPNYFGNTVSIISTSDDGVTHVEVGIAPTDVAITPGGIKAYVTNSVGKTVSVIDVLTNRVIKTINVNPKPD
ncbi:MAG TPA: hypothetical protein VLB01_04450 [Thermodesulfobacteriota bacterium]|nr:hypothetical protein [Thermodesulfobacteriota bacterium]